MREYSVMGQGLTVAGATTLALIIPLAGCTIELVRAWVSQNANATSAQVPIEIGTKVVTSGVTMTGNTPVKLKSSDPISLIVSGTTGGQGTAGINASAEGTVANTAKYFDNFNALNGWNWLPSATLGETLQVNTQTALNGIYMKFTSAPPVLTNWTWGMTFREMG